jgi:tRNA threonylcarbamoyladenosine biosynthesis protein TsaE
MKTWEAYALADLAKVAQELIPVAVVHSPIWLFRGQMGAGKTTLIKELTRQLGVEGHVQSPTFALVNEYARPNDSDIYHFDLYRLKNAQEALDIGMEDYLDSGNICLIEWPEQAEELWTIPHVEFILTTIDENTRSLKLHEHH